MRARLENLLGHAGVEWRMWGPANAQVASQLERRAGMALPAALIEFAREVGNLNLGGMSVIVTGDGTANYDCITETEASGLAGNMIVIMEDAGCSYVLEPATGQVACFESVGLDRDELRRFDSIMAFLEWAIEVSRGDDEFGAMIK